MGIGKPNSSESRLSRSVFRTTRQKRGSVKAKTKLSSPTHGLPQTPFMMLYFWNAIRRPYSGM